MEYRSPDDVAEALARQKATVERIIIEAANRVNDRLEHVELEHEVPC